ncbi:MAG: NUDIX domain-containing protein [Chloroflexota bacterium]
MIGKFIAGISALIWSPKRQKYLLLRRAKTKDFGAGGWECVTGRVDQGEGFPEAAVREVKEELCIDVKLDFLIDTVHFYRGEPVPENELLGVVYHCTYDERVPFTMSDEHDAFEWVTAVEAQQKLPAAHWLLPHLQRAEILRHKLPSDIL